MPAGNNSNAAAPNGSRRDQIAMIVLISGIGGLVILAATIICLDKASAKEVFNALLPMFGTWVGTLLAFYFSKDNFEAATQSVTSMAGKISVASERLQQIPAKDKMRLLKDIGFYPMKKGEEDKCVLSQLLDQTKYDRIPMMDGNRMVYLVYRATINQYLSNVALKKVVIAGKEVSMVSLADAIQDPRLRNTFEKSFGFVSETATLADAQREMERVSKDVPCNDVFVTPSGKPDEAISGWITDNTIVENLKV